MSTTNSKFFIYFLVFSGLFAGVSSISAQQIGVEIKINSDSSEVRVEGKLLQENGLQPNRNWAFLNSAAGAESPGERISGLELRNKEGQNITVKKFAPGEYLAENTASSWNYSVDLQAPKNSKAMAHISWLADGQGILMLGDLLPQFTSSSAQPVKAQISFGLPKDWMIFTGEEKTAENVFDVENIDKAVFLIGKNWRARELLVGADKLNFAISGNWQFSDDEAHKIAADIFTEYRKLFGAVTNKKIQIALKRFPAEVKSGRWEAETRGSNLTVLSSDMPFKTLSLQRLHEQLRHELFHLWIPNNLALSGNYDWFYEGFTVYQALRTGVGMNQIRFEDFLDTLAQAYDLDNRQPQTASLVESSRNRWSGEGNQQAYARGMIVAFLCDITLLRESGGKKSVSDVFEKIYRAHRLPKDRQDGNEVILNVLNSYSQLNFVVEKYVKGTEKINWQADLERAGIEASEENSFTRLKVRAKAGGRQKDLLDKLGYNNWRKVSGKAK